MLNGCFQIDYMVVFSIVSNICRLRQSQLIGGKMQLLYMSFPLQTLMAMKCLQKSTGKLAHVSLKCAYFVGCMGGFWLVCCHFSRNGVHKTLSIYASLFFSSVIVCILPLWIRVLEFVHHACRKRQLKGATSGRAYGIKLCQVYMQMKKNPCWRPQLELG